MRNSSGTFVALLACLLLAPSGLRAQFTTPPLPTWSPDLTLASAGVPRRSVRDAERPLSSAVAVETRGHTKTGLLIGGAVGAVATTVFLVAFCSDPDTACQGDEVARAVLFIGVPITAAGALIGSLIRKER